MFCTVTWNGFRGSWFSCLADAIAYAEGMLGVVAIEEIGKGIVWECSPEIKALWD